MLKNERGTTWIESISAATIICTIIMTFIPIYQLISIERTILQEKRQHTAILFNHLLSFTFESISNTTVTIDMDENNGYYTIIVKNDVIEGCAQWENAKGKKMETCLYSKYIPS